MFLKIIITLVTLSLSLYSSAGQRTELHFLTVDYCPLICQGKENKGIMIDILNEVFPASSFDVKVSFVPITRAFTKPISGKFAGFIGGNKIQLKGNLFPDYVTTPNTVYFYKLKNSKWRFTSYKDLEKHDLLLVKGYGYPSEEFMKFVINNKDKNVYFVNNKGHLSQMTSLISKGRYTTFSDGDLAVDYFLKDHPLRGKIVADKYKVGVFKNYISFYPKEKNSKELLKHFNKEFIKLQKNGTISNIYKRYGIIKPLALIK